MSGPTPEELDEVWKALADPTRRGILDFLKRKARTTGEIVEQFPELSRFGVMKHIDVLRDAELIVVEKKGRERINHLNVVPIRQIHDRWVDGFRSLWTDVLIDAGHLAEGGFSQSDGNANGV